MLIVFLVLQPEPPSSSKPKKIYPSFSHIKRVILKVTKPVPVFSHPAQKPLHPQFDSSLRKFLESYSILQDRDTPPDIINLRAKEEAAFRNRIHQLKKEGRVFPTFDVHDVESSPNSSNLKRTTTDAWDMLIRDVVDYVEMKNVLKRPTGVQIAANVAKMVKVYWEQQAVKQDRARAQEEKRLRALAKSMMRLVTAQWRQAVFVRLSFSV
jgi:helicase SWR1